MLLSHFYGRQMLQDGLGVTQGLRFLQGTVFRAILTTMHPTAAEVGVKDPQPNKTK